MNLIEWCVEHEAQAHATGMRGRRFCWKEDTYELPTPCRMVEKQLVSKDALVIERDGDGWSDWVVRAFEAAGFTVHETISALAALAEAQQRSSE